ncbi:glycosyl hydrolase 115 family protein [Melioribacter sp. OK-6-Me]|uniref:glycosyl hydrolase 115 family protein n=1 Tax=unclassified Melioribacter TaxID=2627329 RepID=UPI003ED97D94
MPIIYDKNDAEVVYNCAVALANDIKLITDIMPDIHNNLEVNDESAIIVGTIGKSKIIDSIKATGKLSVASIEGKWESFVIQKINNPLYGLNQALVVCGSDPRGTAFGIFELSRLLGISPWVYWADVLPQKQKELEISIDKIVMGPPSVKYRGIFLNDEDWGLQPWAAKNIDTDIKDIGPKTYARIFELLLRLKANFIWPAMHPCTKAFFYYKANPLMAKKYNIVLGSSHAEPMLRNNVDEWNNNFINEYGKEPSEWRYDTNSDEIKTYWEDRIKELAYLNLETVVTIGMRGIHDSGMPGPDKLEDKVELLNKVIEDQRDLLAKHFKKDAAEIPQIFCPYKEVLDLYYAGAKIPDDVTIVWADDNYGYIRKLSTSEEQKRSGRSGVYYHLSYWGYPEDYLWLCSTSPSLISYEMSKAYEYGADRLWIFNVGDIKPAEMEIEFAMDLAWDINSWNPVNSEKYIEYWASKTFGKEYAKEIAEIKTLYYRLAASGKPEHLDKIDFTENEVKERLATYQKIARKARSLKEIIPERLQNAYFELILYPILSAAYMNEKIFYARMGDYQKASRAYNEIKKLTDIYNTKIANGKWNGMISMNPRNRPVFNAPDSMNNFYKSVSKDNRLKPIKIIYVRELKFDTTKLCLLPGLGIDGESLSWKNFTGPIYDEGNALDAPTASIQLQLPSGKHIIELICLPTHSVNETRGLRTAISIDNRLIDIIDVNTISGTAEWSLNVLRGFASARTEFNLNVNSMVKLQLSLLDPGLSISRIIIY